MSLQVKISISEHFWRQYTLYKVVESSRFEISEDKVCFGESNHNRVNLEGFLALFQQVKMDPRYLFLAKVHSKEILFSSQLSKQLKETQTVHVGRSRMLWWHIQP